MRDRYTCSWLLLTLLLTAIPGIAQTEPAPSAWHKLIRDNPVNARKTSLLERQLLHRMTPEQLEAYLRGIPPEDIVLKSGETLDVFLSRQGPTNYEIPWHSIDGGGGTSSGENTVLKGTIGQPDAGIMTGGGYLLNGGFWDKEINPSPIPIFNDDFETGDTNNWTKSSP